MTVAQFSRKILSGRVLFDLVLLAGAMWGLQQAFALPPAFGPSRMGASDFPVAVLGLGVVALLILLWQDLRAAMRETGTPGAGLSVFASLGVCAVSALLVFYIALLEPLGFLLSTGFFLFLSILTCTRFLAPPQGRREWCRAAALAAVVAVVATGASYLVFTRGFGLIFP